MVLTFAVSTTAFAAPSVTNNATSGTTSGSGTSTSTSTSTSNGSVTYVRNFSAVAATATDANGNAIEVQVKQLTAAQAAVTAQFGQNVDVLGAGDYSVAGASETNPVTLKFSVAVSAGDNVCILHQHHDGNWYVESATAGDGVVTATFPSPRWQLSAFRLQLLHPVITIITHRNIMRQ